MEKGRRAGGRPPGNVQVAKSQDRNAARAIESFQSAFLEVAAAELPVEGMDMPQDKADRYDRMKQKAADLPPIWPKAGDEVSAIVLGIHQPTFEAEVSIRRYESIQDRKRVAQYLKGAPQLTLGQLLNPGEE